VQDAGCQDGGGGGGDQHDVAKHDQEGHGGRDVDAVPDQGHDDEGAIQVPVEKGPDVTKDVGPAGDHTRPRKIG
jgi:hypothetical protein